MHQVGNKSLGELLFLTQSTINVISDELEESLLSYFLDHFNGFEFFHLRHDEAGMVDVYLAASKIFADPSTLHFQSTTLARRLFDLGTHPQIKSGDFYVAYLEDVELEGELVNCVGLFKAETKDHFVQLQRSADNLQINMAEGTYLGKLDKGCLIYQVDEELGYQVALVDTAGRGQAQYWKDEFIGVVPCANNYNHTQQVMGFAKNFLDQLPSEFETERPDQIDMMNRSLDYFKSHQQFDEKQFAEEVFQDVDVADAFGEYSSNFRQQQPNIGNFDFELDERAVKKNAGQFKSVLKLDRNFHVYIHGDRSMIQKGVEDSGRKFYKLYYSVEQ